MSRCVFENNVGAIFNSSNGNGLINPLIANCLFVNNQADEGGGISNIIYRGALNTSVLNCTFLVILALVIFQAQMYYTVRHYLHMICQEIQ